MKIYLLCIALSILPFLGLAQNQEIVFDQALADSLGADDYGMKAYTLVILKTGNITISDKSVVDSLFRGHLDNISRLAESGELIIAGPLMKNQQNYRGLFVLTETDLNKAKALLGTDPAINEGLLDFDLFNWYGAAALSTYLETQKKITKVNP